MEGKGKLGLLPCIGIIVGGCIGSAIFSLSGQTIIFAGPGALISWAAAAVILAFYGMQVCELAVRFPQSGGIFVFPQKAIGGKAGDFWGFFSAWGYIVSNFIAVAFSAITIGNFMGNAFPSLEGQTNLIIMAVAGVVICLVFNLLKVSDTAKFNYILVALLSLALLVFTFFAVFGKRPDSSPAFAVENFHNFFNTGMGIRGIFRAIPVASVAYGACVSISFMVGEVKNPDKTIPRSLLIGLVIVMVLYLMTIASTVATCSYSMFTAFPFLEFAPQFGCVMDGLSLYPWLSKLIAIAALIALITTILVLMALNSRAIQAVAESGYLPGVFSKSSNNGVPLAATVLSASVSGLLCLFPQLTQTFVELGAFFNVISMAVTCLSLVIARKKQENKAVGYTCPGGIITPIATIVVLGACYLIGSISIKAALFTVGIYTVGVFIFLSGCAEKKK